jgi:hypothetical protein
MDTIEKVTRAIESVVVMDGTYSISGDDAIALAQSAIAAYRQALEAEGMVIVPKEPAPALLRSMAIRYDHGLGCPGYYDHPPMQRDGVTHERRLEATISTMRQLHEEVVGTGFYRAASPSATTTET